MFSMDTEQEAEQLLILACPRNMDGDFVARELVDEQTLENLQAFSDKLAMCYERLNARKNPEPSKKKRSKSR